MRLIGFGKTGNGVASVLLQNKNAILSSEESKETLS